MPNSNAPSKVQFESTGSTGTKPCVDTGRRDSGLESKAQQRAVLLYLLVIGAERRAKCMGWSSTTYDGHTFAASAEKHPDAF